MSVIMPWIVAFLVLAVPGAIMARALRTGSSDVFATLAGTIALGMTFWPVLFLLTTSFGVAWSAAGARVFFGLLVLMLAVMMVKRPPTLRKPDRVEVAGVVLLGIVVWTRVRQIDGIAYPLWVDSVHHTMIIRLLVDGGQLPSSYAPFIPQSTFYYHWGFHAVIAFVAWISGITGADALPRLLLFVGQLLNVLIFLAVYAGAKALIRSRVAALLAATLATLVSFFPAYYVSWGRYTQLCGLLLLPPIAIAFWRLGRHPDVRRAMALALLSGGLLLIHVRVAVIFAVLAAVLAIILALQRRWRCLAWCAAAAAGGAALAAPWLVHLAVTPQVRTILSPRAAEHLRWESPNALPDDLLWAPNNLPLFIAATGGLLGLTPVGHMTIAWRVAAVAWWLALVILLERRARRKRRGVDRRDAWRLAIVVAWVVIVAALINLDQVGLPRFRLLTNSAAIIMLFLPLSLVIAILLRWALPRRDALLALTLAIGVAGASTMIHIVNPRTMLVTEADRRALAWISTHTPTGARFAVGVQPWIGGSYTGIDGGYWIPLVAGRASLLPPGLYPWVMPADRVAAVTAGLEQWYEAAQNGNASILSTLRREGVTHLYFGPRNTTPIREAIAAQPSVARVYDKDGVAIYSFTDSKR